MKEMETSTIFFILNVIFSVIVLFLSRFLNEHLIFTTMISVLLFISLSLYLIKARRYAIQFIFAFFLCVSISFLAERHLVGYTTVLIDDTRVHIGDVDMTNFTPVTPDGTEYTWDFQLKDDPIAAVGFITAKHVDPDFDNGPLLLLVNEKPFSFLNSYVIYSPEEEMFSPYFEYKFDIPASFLKKGKNTFSAKSLFISLLAYDDINIKNLILQVRY